MKRRDHLATVQGLQAELAMARRELERVTGQRDELRKVMGDVRNYAHQEVERAVAARMPFTTPDAAVSEMLRRAAATSRVLEGEPMRPTVALAAHLNDPDPPKSPLMGSCYHPAEDSSMESFWHRCHGSHEPCPEGGHGLIPR